MTTISLTGCYGFGKNTIQPQIAYSVSGWRVQSMPSAFEELSENELSQEWGKEYKIGKALAKQLDLYRAITAFKRAEILTPDEAIERKLEVQYLIVLSYYLGGRYEEAIDAFSDSKLSNIDRTFPAYQDLLVLLYESYQKIDQPEQAKQMLTLIEYENKPKADKLQLSTVMANGDLYELVQASYTPNVEKENKELLDYYDANRKNPKTAQALNIIPGAGYLYVGQKQTAMTAFLLNSLCIAATATLYKNKHYALGTVMASFEAGWFFGGIYGAGEAAKTYNERLYERGANQVMRRNDLFPVLTLQFAF